MIAAPAESPPLMRRFLRRQRIVVLWGPVNEDSARNVCLQLLSYCEDDPQAPIWLLINSPGGANDAGWAIVDTMNASPAPVHTLCVGLAASFGAVLLASGERGFRLAMPHARIMIHQPWLPGEYRAAAADLKIQAEEIRRQRELIDALLARQSGRPVAEVASRSDRDAWFSAEEAAHFGLIDAVIERWPWKERSMNAVESAVVVSGSEA